MLILDLFLVLGVCINVSVRLSVVYRVSLFVFTLRRATQVFLLMAAP